MQTGSNHWARFLDVCPPERITFTYGFVSGKPIPSGSSRVTIRLEAQPDGTQLHLRHEFPEAATRDEHVQGWRFQLSVFSNVVTDEVFADAATMIDNWFGAWMIADDRLREETPLLESVSVIATAFWTVWQISQLTWVRRSGSCRECVFSVRVRYGIAKARFLPDGQPQAAMEKNVRAGTASSSSVRMSGSIR